MTGNKRLWRNFYGRLSKWRTTRKCNATLVLSMWYFWYIVWFGINERMNLITELWELYYDTDAETAFNADCNRWPIPSALNKVSIAPNLVIHYGLPLIKTCSDLQSWVIILYGLSLQAAPFTLHTLLFDSYHIKTVSEALFYSAVNVLLKYLAKELLTEIVKTYKLKHKVAVILDFVRAEEGLRLACQEKQIKTLKVYL